MQHDTYSLERKLNRVYDHLYANADVRTPNGIANEVGKILRALSHLEQTRKKVLPAVYMTPIEKRNLASGDKTLVSFLAKQVKSSFGNMNAAYKLYDKGNDKIILSDFDIAYVCAELDGVILSSKDKDVFGDAMEVFRSSWAKSHGGQFFTDQRVTNLAVKLLQFNPLGGEDIVDICAGTGGFLLAGLNRIKDQLKLHGDVLEQRIEEVAPKSLKGLEIDDDIRSVGNATLAARVKKGLEFIEKANSIEDKYFRGLTRVKYDSHDCVATNPPFGTKITIKDTGILKTFELSRAFGRSGRQSDSYRVVPRPPDVLFLEQNIKLLKAGKGRIAIVLPYQILSGPQTLFIRQWLIKKIELLAVVDLPADTFQPHTGTKACLLIGQRRPVELDHVDGTNDRDIFMSKPKWIGHDRRGNPVFKKSADGTPTAEILSDIENVGVAYEAMLEGGDPHAHHPESFRIKASSVFQDPMLRLDAQYHKSHKATSIRSQESWSNEKDWDLVTLRSVVDRIFYPGRFARSYVDEGVESVPFLGGTNITQLMVQTEKRISTNDRRIEELKVSPHWILVTRSGSTGIVSTVPKAWDGYAISEHVIRIVPDNNRLPYEYLYAFLKTDYAKEVMRKGVYGSVIDEITPEYIGEMMIPIPKDGEKLKQIVNEVRSGIVARDNAITKLTEGIGALEDLFAK